MSLYVVWHPNFADGAVIARRFYENYRRDFFRNVDGGLGISVQNRSTPATSSAIPLPIDFDDTDTTVVVVLLERHAASDASWVQYLDNLAGTARTAGLRARIVPVALDTAGSRIAGAIATVNQARYLDWPGDADAKAMRLTTEVTYAMAKTLRDLLESVGNPNVDRVDQLVKKVTVFLSHTKLDGLEITTRIRDYIHNDTQLDAFFDVHDIPIGTDFPEIIEHYVRKSAVVAVQTDRFASREWCKREIVEAKRHQVPLVVVNAVCDIEDRGFPYLGNVPVVRMNSGQFERIPMIIARLLDEVLKDFMWRCRVEIATKAGKAPGVTFVPRSPELIVLAAAQVIAVTHTSKTIVYPDPPLGPSELELFEVASPLVRFLTYTEWLADV